MRDLGVRAAAGIDFEQFFLTHLLGDAGPALQMILTVLTDPTTFAQVLTIARDVVKALEGEPGSGPEKHAAAVAAIEAKAAAVGIAVGKVLLSLAAELALAELRALLAEAA